MRRRNPFKRGSLVRHPKHGLCSVGGAMGDRVSLHHTATGKRLCQNARPADLGFRAFNGWRTRFLPAPKDGASARELR